MHFSILAQPVAALVAGILILLVPETIELYCCHLSHYIWHPRAGPLIDGRSFYCEKSSFPD